MPKAFSEDERAIIVRRLEVAAETIMNSGSIRKASVGEIAAGAGISKGAFYLFFPSKEHLFFSVILKKHEAIESSITARFKALRDPDKADVTEILLDFFRATYESFLPRLMSGGELEILMRRLPPETVAAHRIDDAGFVKVIAGAVPALSELSGSRSSSGSGASSVLGSGSQIESGSELAGFCSSALRAVFLLGLHRAEIGEDQFDRVVRTFVERIVEKLFEGAKYD